jgi:hypothetical protein
MDLKHVYVARTCIRDMQHVEAMLTRSLEMHLGHAAKICSKDMQFGYAYGHAVWTCSIKM